MKNRIRKILRESDFDWTEENTNEVPIKDIEDWVDKTRYEVAGWIQKIDEFYKKAPQVDWNSRSDMEEEDKMWAERPNSMNIVNRINDIIQKYS